MEGASSMSTRRQDEMMKCPNCGNLVIDIHATGCPYCDEEDDSERTFSKRLEEGFEITEEDDI